MRTGRYQAVPLRSIVGGRFRPSTVDFCRLRSIQGEIDRRRSIEEEKGKEEKKKRRRSTSRHPSGDSARGSPASRRRSRCPSAVAARAALAPSRPAGFFLPARGDRTSPHAGESSRRQLLHYENIVANLMLHLSGFARAHTSAHPFLRNGHALLLPIMYSGAGFVTLPSHGNSMFALPTLVLPCHDLSYSGDMHPQGST
ncbi:hypothetical protein GW17_00015213 [Ensete ventricosum]|nr:hypothetical protein GW17_00015213 [Ensete ventricosum]